MSSSVSMQNPNTDPNTGHLEDEGQQQPALKLDTIGALQNIEYNAVVAAENGISSEDEVPEDQDIPAEDAWSAIGISISREQTRLTSPQTPAAEKAAAIARSGGYFGTFDRTEELVEEEEEDGEELGGGSEDYDGALETEVDEKVDSEIAPIAPGLPKRPPSQSQVQLPSPWRVDQTGQWQTGTRSKPGLFDGIFNRRRAASGADSTSDSRQKSLLSSLPSVSNPFSFGSASSRSQVSVQAPQSDTNKRPTSSPTPRHQRAYSDGRVAKISSSEAAEPLEVANERTRRTSIQTAHSRVGLLRHSTSDHSLTTLRTLSRVESLGDDSRFEDIQSQVNNRLKALRDSWQDANIKVPSLSSIKVPSFAPDFLRERGASTYRRQNPALASIEATRGISANQVKPNDFSTKQTYSSTRGAVPNASAGKVADHPHFHRALSQLEGDLVILGGYRGSILRDAESYRQVWVPIKVGLNIRKVNLAVGFEEADDERATNFIFPDGMLTHIGPVDISRRLFKRLRSCENARTGKLTVWDYGYDWRLSPEFLSQQLIRYLEQLPCNRPGVARERRGATVIAHSLGGLITRHAINQRPELFRGVVYAGVPQTCVNILGPLRNGDDVMLSNRTLTAQVNFSIRSSFALLPLDGRCFFDMNTNEEYPVDFFDVNTWIDLRLSPCVGRCLPPLQAPPKPSGITGYVSSMASVLPSLPFRGRKDNGKLNDTTTVTTAGGFAGVSMSGNDTLGVDGDDSNSSAATIVTVDKEKAIEYLDRTLKGVKRFKQDLAFNPKHAEANAYPPIAVIYGKSTPTVYGAKVNGREGIKHADAYDSLAFASGDGVVLARAAMAPEGYKPARGGIVASDRGHVTLLGDLEAVGRCLNAIIKARKRGVGYGT